jgi:hypothetical protein
MNVIVPRALGDAQHRMQWTCLTAAPSVALIVQSWNLARHVVLRKAASR